jgi:RNA polymerase sigma-70 factor (ECF subfamily)
MRQADHRSMPSHDLHTDVSDEELVRRALAQDTAAYGDLVRRHQLVALRLAAGICGSAEEARDIVQDAFVQGYRSLHRYRGEAPVRSWLLRIVANRAKNAIRASSRRRHREDRSVGLERQRVTDPVGDEVAGDRDAAAQLAALTALPTRDREVLAARYLAGLTEAETAALLDVPVGTVKSRSSRALAHARALLELGEVSHG